MNFFGFLSPFFASITATSPIPYIIASIAVLYAIYGVKRLLDV